MARGRVRIYIQDHLVAKLVSFLPHLAQGLNEGVDSDGEWGVCASGKSENSSTSLPHYSQGVMLELEVKPGHSVWLSFCEFGLL